MSTGCKKGAASLSLRIAFMEFCAYFFWCAGIGFAGRLFMSGSAGGFGAGTIGGGAGAASPTSVTAAFSSPFSATGADATSDDVA